MKAEIRRRIAQGWTKQQILDEMVANFGPGVLSTPATHGFDLLAWALPIGGIGAGALALGGGAWYWTRPGRRTARTPTPTSSTRMRWTPIWSGSSTTSSPGSMLEKLPVAFLAGLVSVLTPCVLPLVPGYLSAVSAVDVTKLGERGVGRRVVAASMPFIAGFTTVFVVLGAAAAAVGSVVDQHTQFEIAGFVLVVLGLAFLGALPMPERIFAPGLLRRARGRGSSALLGGAFAVCAAPCIGTVLASILVLASSSGTIVRGIVLLAAYSLGLGAAFVARRRRVRAHDARVPLRSRPLRGRARRSQG